MRWMLPVFNVLGLMTYFSGHLSQNFNGTICTHLQKEDLVDLFAEVDMTFKTARHCSTQPKNYALVHNFSKNGSIISRFLYSMGFHLSKGSKASVGSSIPQYLSHIIDNFHSLNKHEKHFARPLIVDFVKVLFECKNFEGNRFSIYLLGQPEQSQIYRQGELVVNALNVTYKRLFAPNSLIRCYENQGKYTGMIAFGEKFAERMSDPRNDAIFDAELNKKDLRYSFEEQTQE